MHVDIACHHTTLTDGLREAVHQKLDKLSHHTDQRLSARVVLTVEKNQQIAEATVLINGKPEHARATAENLYAALDKLVSRLDRALRKNKTRTLQRTRGTHETLRGLSPG